MRTIFLMAILLLMAEKVLAADDTTYLQSNSVDWKYYGGLENGYCFFDSGSIKRSTKSNQTIINVWIKCLPKKDVDKFINAKVPDNELVNPVAEKIAKYYVPPILEVTTGQHNSVDSEIMITDLEEIADIKHIEAIGLVYYELNCQEQKYHELSISLSDKNGKQRYSDEASEWKYIPPEGNISNLSKITCR